MADSLTLEQVLKQISKKYSDDKNNIIQFGVDNVTKFGTLSLGSPSLDFCLYNSLPEGKMIEISGSESSGKTTITFLIAADFIRKELQRNPDNPRHILFVDAECACDPEWAYKSTGYDMNRKDVRTIYITPAGQSAEQIFDMVIDLVKTGEIGLVIFDSLTAVVSQQTVDESMTKKDMGGIAKPLGDFCKKITGILNKHRTTFIGINGLTENIGGYGETEITPGGRTWKRACMVRLRMKRGAFFDADGNELTTKAQSPAGHIIEMFVYKTKVCPWDRKLGRCHLDYVRGIDLLADTIDVATIFGLIDNSVQGTFKIIDPDTGEVMTDETGQEVKIRGRKNLKPYFEQHQDLWKKIYDIIYDKMSIKTDPNVVAFESMLNVDVNASLGFNLETIDQDRL